MPELFCVREWGQTIRACGPHPLAPSPVPLERGRGGEAAPTKAVFLDRDGTLIADRPYSADPDRIELLPGVVEGLALLRDAGFLLVVATNQSGIARGYFSALALARMHCRLNELLETAKVRVAAYYYCPHHVDGTDPALARACDCRKPSPGMILRAARDWSVDLGKSWLIGNALTDGEAAESAGCRALLVGGDRSPGPYPWVDGLDEAARRIIANDGSGRGGEAGGRRAVRRA